MRLYHNPRCSKSRQAVAILSESGVVFEEYRYLELGIAEEDLEILASLDGIIRTNEKEFKQNKFDTNDNDAVKKALIAIPKLLESLGVITIPIYCDPTGHFPHNPEPLKEHLSVLSEKVLEEKADFGIVVDPDVDRLAFVDEYGGVFGEEYTLVACSDYVLSKTPGNTVFL